MRGLLVVLAACSYERSVEPVSCPAVSTVSADASVAPVVVLPPDAQPVATRPPSLLAPEPRPARVATRPDGDATPARHGDDITQVALTDDGLAAVSLGKRGGVRLWPALDGTIEPVVVAADHPSALAVVRTNDHYVIATLDRAGTLAMITVTASGVRTYQRIVDSPRPFTRVVATSVGFAALRDDHTIALFDGLGIGVGDEAAGPGERIVALVTRGPRTLAMISTVRGVHGRWLLPNGWGEATPVLPIDPAHVALSPDGTRIAAARLGQPGIVVIDVAGHVIEKLHTEDSEGVRTDPVGYLTSQDLLVSNGFEPEILRGGQALPSIGIDEPRDFAPRREFAVGDGLAVTGRLDALVLIAPPRVRYLGFGAGLPTSLVHLDHGYLLADRQHLVRVDERFAERERYPLPPNVDAVVPIDTHRALVLQASNPSYDLIAYDLDDPERSRLLVAHAQAGATFDARSQTYAVPVEHGVAFGRYDAKTRTWLGPVVRSVADFALASAVLPDGDVVVVNGAGGDLARADVLALDFAHGTSTVKRSRTVHTNTLFAPDWPGALGFLPRSTIGRGTRTVRLEQARITLREGNVVRWVVPAHGITQLRWDRDDAILGIGNGLVHLDVETGEPRDAHCGWWFGISDVASSLDGVAATVCE